MKVSLVLYSILISFIGTDAVQDGYLLNQRIIQITAAVKNSIRKTTDPHLVSVINDVKIKCYNRKFRYGVNLLTVGEKLLNFRLPFMFLVHGWLDGGNKIWVKRTINDFLENFDEVICPVDWSRMARFTYEDSANYTVGTGKYLAEVIRELPINIDTLTLVGHSMGAHIVGITGSELNGKVPKIFGLDPARAIFDNLPKELILDQNDGKYVQAVHTDVLVLGSAKRFGHQDFWANDGLIQPGCLLPSLDPREMNLLTFECDHFRAVEYFRSSLYYKHVFISTKCESYERYRFNKCANNAIDRFGVYARNKEPGVYYFSPKGKYPYV